jgi:hypothetical protein
LTKAATKAEIEERIFEESSRVVTWFRTFEMNVIFRKLNCGEQFHERIGNIHGWKMKWDSPRSESGAWKWWWASKAGKV